MKGKVCGSRQQLSSFAVAHRSRRQYGEPAFVLAPLAFALAARPSIHRAAARVERVPAIRRAPQSSFWPVCNRGSHPHRERVQRAQLQARFLTYPCLELGTCQH